MTFRRPPKLKTAEDFISSAGTPVQAGQALDTEADAPVAAPPSGKGAPRAPAAAAAERTTPLPWEGKRNDKQTEVFNLRLTEVELEKLRFISTHTPDSMQAFVRKVLLPAIDAKLHDMM